MSGVRDEGSNAGRLREGARDIADCLPSAAVAKEGGFNRKNTARPAATKAGLTTKNAKTAKKKGHKSLSLRSLRSLRLSYCRNCMIQHYCSEKNAMPRFGIGSVFVVLRRPGEFELNRLSIRVISRFGIGMVQGLGFQVAVLPPPAFALNCPSAAGGSSSSREKPPGHRKPRRRHSRHFASLTSQAWSNPVKPSQTILQP
jgi:hypothetical protein